MTKAIALAAVVLALGACGSPDLKAEQEAWKRLAEHTVAAQAPCTGRERPHPLKAKRDALETARVTALAASDQAHDVFMRAADAHLTAMGTPAPREEIARLEAERKATLAQAEKASKASLAALKESMAASDAWRAARKRCEGDTDPEASALAAEYKAACGKCGVPERCEANLEHNGTALSDSNPNALDWKYDARLYRFACQK